MIIIHRFLLALLAVFATGCASQLIEPSFPVENKKMVVLPFSCVDEERFDCKDGIDLARRITAQVSVNGNEDELVMVEQNELVSLDQKREIRTLSLEELAVELGADYVCLGKITRFKTRQYGDIGFLRGVIGVDYEVRDFSNGGKVVFTAETEYRYPDSRTNEFVGHPITMANDETIAKGLLRMAAWRMALNFYSHLEDEEAKPMR